MTIPLKMKILVLDKSYCLLHHTGTLGAIIAWLKNWSIFSRVKVICGDFRLILNRGLLRKEETRNQRRVIT